MRTSYLYVHKLRGSTHILVEEGGKTRCGKRVDYQYDSSQRLEFRPCQTCLTSMVKTLMTQVDIIRMNARHAELGNGDMPSAFLARDLGAAEKIIDSLNGEAPASLVTQYKHAADGVGMLIIAEERRGIAPRTTAGPCLKEDQSHAVDEFTGRCSRCGALWAEQRRVRSVPCRICHATLTVADIGTHEHFGRVYKMSEAEERSLRDTAALDAADSEPDTRTAIATAHPVAGAELCGCGNSGCAHGATPCALPATVDTLCVPCHVRLDAGLPGTCDAGSDCPTGVILGKSGRVVHAVTNRRGSATLCGAGNATVRHIVAEKTCRSCLSLLADIQAYAAVTLDMLPDIVPADVVSLPIPEVYAAIMADIHRPLIKFGKRTRAQRRAGQGMRRPQSVTVHRG